MALLLTGLSCRKQYFPAVITADTNILVVEGVINAGSDSTFIKLSHTVKLSEKTSTQPEKGATVTLEGEGATYNLNEIGSGIYASAGLNLNSTKTYRLKIRTLNSQQYQSDDMPVKITPPIDSLNYAVENDGVHIYTAAHDATSNTRYYRWDYDETWRFNAFYNSNYKVVGNTIQKRVYPQDEVYKCYSSSLSSVIILGSSAKLAGDVVTRVPVTQITPSSEKVSIRYSILLRQYALTKEAYAFWENLKKNTEQLGSIFDALPSEISGNIHNTANVLQPVIGFISISTIPAKRIYINRIELPFNPQWRTQYPLGDCGELQATGPDVLNNIINAAGYNVPTFGITDPMGKIIGYGYSTRNCADCTIRGTTKKPAFWIE